MSNLPIRKEGDELRVRDAAGVIFKGVVESVENNGTFQLLMPDGHSVSDQQNRSSHSWCFFRNQLTDFGLTILGPWTDSTAESDPALRIEALAAAVSLAAQDTGSGLYSPSDIVSSARQFHTFLIGV